MNKSLKILSVIGYIPEEKQYSQIIAKFEIAAKKLGHDIKIEISEFSKSEFSFTKNEIDEADLILIISNSTISKKRFLGKKIYSTDADLSIISFEKLLNKAINNGTILTNLKTSNIDESKTTNKSDNLLNIDTKSSIIKHIMFALTWTIPLIIGGALSLALGMVIGLDPGWIQNTDGGWEWGKVLNLDAHSLANNFYLVGTMCLELIFPILAAGIAYSISGKLGFAPAFIGGYIMNDGDFLNLYLETNNGSDVIYTPIGTGFFGAIVIGFFVGYLINLYKKIPINKKAKPILDFLLVPFIGIIVVIIVSRYIFGPVLGPAVIGMFNGLDALENMNSSIGIYIIAIIVGMMICFDLGGPVNKTAYIFATWVWVASMEASSNPSDWDFIPYTAMRSAIAIPPLGAFFATTVFGKKFTKQERSVGYSVGIMGFAGITEGAIPFAATKPKVFVPANLIGGASVGALCTAFSFHWYAGLASPLDGFLGYVPTEKIDSYFLGAIIYAMVLISCSLLTAFFIIVIITSSEKNVRYVIYKNEKKVKLEIAINDVKEKTTKNIVKLEKELDKLKKTKIEKENILSKIELVKKDQKAQLLILKKNYKNDLKVQKEKFTKIFTEAKITKKENIINWKEENKLYDQKIKAKIDKLVIKDSFEIDEKQLKNNINNLKQILKTNIILILKNKEIKLIHKYSTISIEKNNYKKNKKELLNKNNYYILRKQLVDAKKEMKNNVKNEHQIMVHG